MKKQTIFCLLLSGLLRQVLLYTIKFNGYPIQEVKKNFNQPIPVKQGWVRGNKNIFKVGLRMKFLSAFDIYLDKILFFFYSGLLCDLLWSDPDKDVQGWGENDRGVSFTFGADVVSKFLNRHDLDLICRAHQVLVSQISWFCVVYKNTSKVCTCKSGSLRTRYI